MCYKGLCEEARVAADASPTLTRNFAKFNTLGSTPSSLLISEHGDTPSLSDLDKGSLAAS